MPGFVPENDLERSLVQLRQGLLRKEDIQGQLLEGALYVMYAGPQPEVSEGKLAEGAQISLLQVQRPEGNAVVCFTSERLVPQKPWMRLNGEDILAMVKGQRLLIDPGTSIELPLEPADVDALLRKDR